MTKAECRREIRKLKGWEKAEIIVGKRRILKNEVLVAAEVDDMQYVEVSFCVNNPSRKYAALLAAAKALEGK